MPTSRRDQTLLVSFVGFFFSAPLYPAHCIPTCSSALSHPSRPFSTLHSKSSVDLLPCMGQPTAGLPVLTAKAWKALGFRQALPTQCLGNAGQSRLVPSFCRHLFLFSVRSRTAQPPPMLIILLHSKSSTLPASSGHNLFVWSLRAEFSFLSICRLHCFCSKPALVRQKHWLSLENSCQSVCAKIPPEQSGGCLSGLIAILWADLAVLKAKS